MLGGAVSPDEGLSVTTVAPRERRHWRREWFGRVADKLASYEMVFADPDNGIVDDDSSRKGRATFGKQMPLEEVRGLANGDLPPRHAPPWRSCAEVDHWLQEIDLPGLAVRATAYNPRTFFVPNPAPLSARRIRAFCENWRDLRVRLHTLP